MTWSIALVRRWRRSRSLRRSLARLPERQRQVFLLTARDDLSYSEAADRLGISPRMVEADLACALRALSGDPATDDDR